MNAHYCTLLPGEHEGQHLAQGCLSTLDLQQSGQVKAVDCLQHVNDAAYSNQDQICTSCTPAWHLVYAFCARLAGRVCWQIILCIKTSENAVSRYQTSDACKCHRDAQPQKDAAKGSTVTC